MRFALPLFVAAALAGQELEIRKADIISEGTRMAAEVYSPRGVEGKLPTVIMCHGWGGTAAGLRREARAIAQAGYLVVVFDYRGWGASDSRILLTGPAPANREGGRFTAEVREVREVVDPVDQTQDLLNAIHWVHGEPRADTTRIGLWGSSYSGGHVIWAAARDHRIKAVFSQVGGMDSRPLAKAQKSDEVAARRARGELAYPEPAAKVVGNLRGAPIVEKMSRHAPAEDAAMLPRHCAVLYVIAEKEELFDNRDHGIKAHRLTPGPKKLVSIPGITHYGIYNEAREQAQKLAIEWFDQYLKGAK